MNKPESGEECKYRNENKKTKFIFNFNYFLNIFDPYSSIVFFVLCIVMSGI
jgi:hypothetical protein